VRAQLVSGRRGRAGCGSGGCGLRRGPAQEERGEERGKGGNGPAALLGLRPKRRGGRSEGSFFSFFYLFFQHFELHFQMNLNSIFKLDQNQSSHNKYATAFSKNANF
jgi:hypothetical protein